MKNCLECGKEFIEIKSNQKFCSRKCLGKNWREKRIKKKEIKNCIECNKKLIGFQRKFCSNYCKGKKISRDYMNIPENKLKQKEKQKKFKITHPNYQKEYKEKNKEHLKKLNVEWLKNHPEFLEKKKLRNIGLTIEQYNNILFQQNNKCLICNISLTKKNIAKDHNHETGKFRGILCRKCNSGIGFLNDNIKLLQDATKYLKERNERRLIN